MLRSLSRGLGLTCTFNRHKVLLILLVLAHPDCILRIYQLSEDFSFGLHRLCPSVAAVATDAQRWRLRCATPRAWPVVRIKLVRLKRIRLLQWNGEVAFRISDISVDLLPHALEVGLKKALVLELLLFLHSVADQSLTAQFLLSLFHCR